MESDIVILKKSDLMEVLESNNKRLFNQLSFLKKHNGEPHTDGNVKVKRLNTRKIKEMLGVRDTTFESIQNDLPLHRTKSGRIFAYEHDLIIYLFREHPPYFDIQKFKEYISHSSLVEQMK